MKKLFLIIIAALCLVGCNTNNKPEYDNSQQISSDPQIIDPIVVPDTIDTLVVVEKPFEKSVSSTKRKKTKVSELVDHQIIIEEIPELNMTVDTVGMKPHFPGGDTELYKFISQNLKYPVVAQENGIQGLVVIGFMVKKDGSIDKPRVVRWLDPSCDKEALRVVKAMPKWLPAKQNGVAVDFEYIVPIRFQIKW